MLVATGFEIFKHMQDFKLIKGHLEATTLLEHDLFYRLHDCVLDF